MDNRQIGIFDSGIGGLTVFSEIVKKLPCENIIYLGDTKRFPYGIKSQETIVELTKKNIEFLISKDVKVIVIACGTATSQALDAVRGMYNVPIIGVIEPTVLDITKEQIQSVGVIATVSTIKSNAWEKEIKKHLKDITVVNKACSILAGLAEEGWTDNEIAKLTIKEYLKGFKNTKIDKLILGCTHYPLFKKLIKEELEENVEIIDTGVKVAEYLADLLENENKINNQTQNGNYNIYLTDTETNFLKFAQTFINEEVTVEKVSLH